MMKTFSLFVAFTLSGICLGAEPRPASTRQRGESTCERKTVSEWVAQCKDKDAEVRSEAAWALVRIRPAARTSIPSLTTLLDDEDVQVRKSAADASQKIKNK
jgi:hypothetical protein